MEQQQRYESVSEKPSRIDDALSARAQEIRQNLQNGNAAFTGQFLYEAFQVEPTRNMIMSPFSIFVPIGELALYAGGNTRAQLLNALNLKNDDEIRSVFPKLTEEFRADKSVTLNAASRIFAAERYPLTQEFLDDTKTVFDAEAECINFGKPREAANRINEWVESQTNNRIQNIASPDMFGSDTRLVLANAIYFLGDWKRSFDVGSTIDRPFRVSNESVIRIPTMHQTNHFNYANVRNLDCQVLEMFYNGNTFSFVVFLPNEIEGLAQLVKTLQDPSVLYAAYDSLVYTYVDLLLPKFKIESEFNLVEILSQIGISDLFAQRKCELHSILQTPASLYVSAAKQKAFVEVDEKGTEAAAANIFVASITSLGPRPRPVSQPFHADHPFVFYIMFQREIIFSGVFNG